MAAQRRPWLVAGLLLSGLLVGTAQGQSLGLDSARTQLEQGQWQGAATAGAALNTAAGYALAAEALIDGADLTPPAGRKALYQKALAYAQQATRADPNSATAYL